MARGSDNGRRLTMLQKQFIIHRQSIIQYSSIKIRNDRLQRSLPDLSV